MKPLALFALCLLLGACATKPSPEPRKADGLVSRSTYPYKMAPLDRTIVKLSDNEEEVIEVSIEGTAFIQGTARRVKDMPLEEFRALVRKAYPKARSIEVEEFRPNQISVLGEVYHQLHTDLTDGPMRLMDAIAGANGFTALANKRRVRLIRQNAGEIEVYEFDLRKSMRGEDMEQNILLKPGDVITVPRNFL